MIVDAYLVFRQSAVRVRDGAGRWLTRVESSPAYACEDEAAAKALSEAVAEASGMPSPIGRVQIWKGGANGEG